MIDKIKLACVGILVGLVFGFFIPRQPEIETKKDVIYAKGITTVVYRSSGTVVNATQVTIRANGETIASGTNLSISTAAQTQTTIVTTFKETETIKYNTSDWAVSGLASVPLSLPITFKPESIIIYRKIIWTAYLGVGYGNNSAIVSALVLF